MASRRGARQDGTDDETSDAGAPPDRAQLREAALSYLARYAATQAGLARVLDRRIDTWARKKGSRYEAGEQDRAAVAAAVACAKAMVREVVAALTQAGAVSDAAFAEMRASRLRRAGRSRNAVVAALAAKGVDPETARRALQNEEVGGDAAELTAALRLARKRRIGPFRAGEPPDPPGRLKELAILARAGFAQPLARQALGTERAAAEALLGPRVNNQEDGC
jgi:regulatory protein